MSLFRASLALLTALATLYAPPLRAAPEAPLVPVMEAVRADDWDKAAALAQDIGPVAADIVRWRRLRAGEGDFDDYLEFTARRADWPGMARLRAEGERVIPPDARATDVLAYFADAAPATGAGAVRLVQAHAALDQAADAQALAVATWRTLPLAAADHATLLQAYGPVLAPHHVDRLDAMLWDGAEESARLMLDHVDRGWRALAVARMALRADRPGVDALIAAVPERLARDPGLAWERFTWRSRRGRTEDAAALLDARSIGFQSLGRPARWAGWRHVQARLMMQDGDPERAYRLAANHYLHDGATYAQLEWLAGFIALRKLDEADLALAHFDRFATAVQTPISLGRAGYWRGRALEALGRPEEARTAYAQGAAHQTSFYGQLAAERAGLTMDPALAAPASYPDWRSRFAGDDRVRAARLFHEAGERNLAEWVLTHMAEGTDAPGRAALAGLALDWDEPHIALRIAKVAARRGEILPGAYFPVSAFVQGSPAVPAELVLAIARRESEFDPAVISPAGARGLMQLMPGTARDMARDEGLDYDAGRLLTDAGYNARLGTAYLATLVEEFGLNPVLVAAGYNAGPTRPRAWIEDRGDPRDPAIDPVDWIETIPFRETRNYVMRVAESLAIYRARIAERPVTLNLSRELKAR